MPCRMGQLQRSRFSGSTHYSVCFALLLLRVFFFSCKKTHTTRSLLHAAHFILLFAGPNMP